MTPDRFFQMLVIWFGLFVSDVHQIRGPHSVAILRLAGIMTCIGLHVALSNHLSENLIKRTDFYSTNPSRNSHQSWAYAGSRSFPCLQLKKVYIIKLLLPIRAVCVLIKATSSIPYENFYFYNKSVLFGITHWIMMVLTVANMDDASPTPPIVQKWNHMSAAFLHCWHL